MCLSKVFLLDNGNEKLISESICNVLTNGNDITLYDIIGQTTTVRGTIQNVDLLKKIILIKAAELDKV